MKQEMIKQLWIILVVTMCGIVPALGQQIVLEVGDSKTTQEEFVYLYEKNSMDSTRKWTEESLKEYARLYADFRLKIEEARREGLDTTAAFQQEFNQYRQQLNESYLSDKKVTDLLVREAYERLQEEVRAAHILLTLSENASPKDTLRVFQRMQRIRNEAVSGADFSELAKKYSEDPSVAQNAGDLGYFSALRMVYPFEEAAYTTAVSKVSEIIRTRFGYHILKVKDRRPNRGQVQVAHIFIHQDSAQAEERIRTIYKRLQEGASWQEQCAQYSNDVRTSKNGGLLLPFESAGNRPELQDMVEAAFRMEKPDSVSAPVRSAYGWHLLKLVQKRSLPSFEALRPQLVQQIERDARSKVRQTLFYERLMAENNFRKASDFQNILLSQLDSSLLRGQWSYDRMNAQALKTTLFYIEDQKYSLRGFYRYAEREQRPQMPEASLALYARQLFDAYLKEELLTYERLHLEEKHPEYRFLVREYYEGILFFDIMNKYVWGKAMRDPKGLEAFFKENQANYRWEERADAVVYTLSDPALLEKLRKERHTLSDEELLSRYNAEDALTLDIKRGKYEQADFPADLEKIQWKAGTYTLEGKDFVQLIEIRELIPPTAKQLSEVRGAVVGDYQKQLEAEWLKQLRARYPVTIHEKLLEKMAKSK